MKGQGDGEWKEECEVFTALNAPSDRTPHLAFGLLGLES